MPGIGGVGTKYALPTQAKSKTLLANHSRFFDTSMFAAQFT
jgi:hypothetical protein